MALLYLAVLGSGVGFSAYVYVLKHSAATRVATYAFVNPVVALFLGWSLGGEPLTLRTMLASAIILAAVLLGDHCAAQGCPAGRRKSTHSRRGIIQ